MTWLLSRIDLTARLLIAAIVLAIVLPAHGQGRDVAQAVSNAAIFVLFFLNGVRLSRAEVWRGLASWRLLVPLALWCFGAMALAGLGLEQLARGVLPPLVALGFLYLGVLPSTVQSATAYSSLAHGNVALSVVAAALLNIAGIFLSAPILALLEGRGAVAADMSGLIRIASILLLPFVLGQLLQRPIVPLVRERAGMFAWMDRTAIAIAVYVAFSGAVMQRFWEALDLSGWLVLFGLVGAFLLFAFAGSWWLGGALTKIREDRISFLFAGAHKSIAMGAPLALVIFSPAEAGQVLVPVLLYHLVQLLISAPVATRLAASRP